MGLGHLVLGRRSVPEAKWKEVIALGTFATASAWSRSQFKSVLLANDSQSNQLMQMFPALKNVTGAGWKGWVGSLLGWVGLSLGAYLLVCNKSIGLTGLLYTLIALYIISLLS